MVCFLKGRSRTYDLRQYRHGGSNAEPTFPLAAISHLALPPTPHTSAGAHLASHQPNPPNRANLLCNDMVPNKAILLDLRCLEFFLMNRHEKGVSHHYCPCPFVRVVLWTLCVWKYSATCRVLMYSLILFKISIWESLIARVPNRMANTFIGTSMSMCLLQVPCVDVNFPGDFEWMIVDVS